MLAGLETVQSSQYRVLGESHRLIPHKQRRTTVPLASICAYIGERFRLLDRVHGGPRRFDEFLALGKVVHNFGSYVMKCRERTFYACRSV